MQFVATIAVVVSVLVLAVQTRAVSKEERIANQVAGTRAHRDLLKMLGAVNDRFFEHPELWAHFFGKASSEPSASDAIRLRVIAENLADALQAGVDTTVKLASYAWVTSEWRQYAAEAIASSPILRATIRDRPGIWTPLEGMVAEYDAEVTARAPVDDARPSPAR
jgi:hypothetical protein